MCTYINQVEYNTADGGAGGGLWMESNAMRARPEGGKGHQQWGETTPFSPSRGEVIVEGTRELELEAFGHCVQLVGSTTWGA